MKTISQPTYMIIILSVLLASPKSCFSQLWKVGIVKNDEPGERLIIKGKILQADGITPVSNARIWVFQTDNEGFYRKSSTGKDLGWRKARISKVFTTGPKGQFEIHTIKPAGYPDRTTPSHVHFRISTTNIKEQEHTILFKGDSRISKSLHQEITRDPVLYLIELSRNDRSKLSAEIRLVLK